MALTDYKITETERDTLGITTANDQYINQAGTIKARFDALPKTIINKYNQLIDALLTEFSTTSPEIYNALNLNGNGTRRLNVRWSSGGAGDAVYIYVTPDGGTEQQIVNVSAANKYITGLRIKDANSFTFVNETTITHATFPTNFSQADVNMVYKIPGGIVVAVNVYSKQFKNNAHVFTLPSGYRPLKQFLAQAVVMPATPTRGLYYNFVKIGADGKATITTVDTGTIEGRLQCFAIIPQGY